MIRTCFERVKYTKTGVVCQEKKSPRYGVFSQALLGEPDRKLL
jgi:hypothetical protein